MDAQNGMPHRKAKGVLPIILIVFIAFAVYLNTLQNAFVYDDNGQVLKNYLIRDVRNIPQMFSRSVWAFQSAPIISNYYRPLMGVIYMVNYYIFGLKPWGFHLANIFFHAANSVLVFLVTRRLLIAASPQDVIPACRESFLKDAGRAGMTDWAGGGSQPLRGRPSSYSLLSLPFIAALLFAAHPIHTEAVSWVAGVPELSCALFYLLSFYFYIRSEEGLKSAYLISVAAFLFACFSKEPALTLPLVLMGYDYLLHNPKKSFWGRGTRYLPYFIVAAAYLALRHYALGGIAPLRQHQYLSTLQYIINIFPLFLKYLEKLILPVNLNTLHVFHPILSLFETIGFLSVAITAVFVIMSALAYRKNKLVCFFLLFFIVPLLPVFYIRGLGVNAFAERYLYLPSVGFVSLVAMFLTRIAGRGPRGKIILIGSLALLTGLYSIGTVKRNAVWQSDYTLFDDTLKKSPDSAIAHENFATALTERNRLDEAIRHFRIALDLDPDYGDAHTNLGIALYKKGLIDQAIEEGRIAVELAPDMPEWHFNLAQQLADKQLWKEAAKEYEAAVRLAPGFADAHNGLGFAYAMLDSIDRAIGEFGIAARLEPDNPMYRKNLARAYEIKKTEAGGGRE